MSSSTGELRNWAGNVEYRAVRVHLPESVDELRRLVGGARRVRALGTGHSFNRIADTTGDLVSLAALPSTVDIGRGAATVPAGMRYGELAVRLHAAGYALPNLASLPHLSVAGAVATGTHGSGTGTGGLGTSVSALELVGPDGTLRTVRRGDPDFPGSVVALGALGIVTRLTLDLVPAYEVAQYVHDDVPYEHLDAALRSGYSVSCFTDWTASRFTQVWRKCRTDLPDPGWSVGVPADGPRHPIRGLPGGHCTEQLGRPGPWYARLPHFRLEFTPSHGDELQSEYLLGLADAADALAALDAVRDRLAPVALVSELRAVAADELWLSPGYRRDTLAIHFTWRPEPDAVYPAIAAVEEALAPYAPRPHWGKLARLDPATVAATYDRYDDFRALVHRCDPDGKFGNEFLDAYLRVSSR
jgi:alditol oxidase